jgi:RNA polymerase sigma-70 factor (ECF subfamily)
MARKIKHRDDLVARCQEGDLEAMQMLYQQNNKQIYSIALRMSNSKADAEDVVQDTFVKAFKHLPRFRGDSSVSTWLSRITINLCRDLYKKQSRQNRQLDSSDNYLSPSILSESKPTDILQIKKLELALMQLPLGYREVLVLHDVIEMDHKEIGLILGIKEGTSKSQLHKARAKMRKIMAD